MTAGAQLTFDTAWHLGLVTAPPTFGVEIPISLPNLATSSQTCPEVCLLGDSRFSQVDNIIINGKKETVSVHQERSFLLQ